MRRMFLVDVSLGIAALTTCAKPAEVSMGAMVEEGSGEGEGG